MAISSKIRVSDGGVEISLKFTLWKNDNDGHGIVKLDPADEQSRRFMADERSALKANIGLKYNLGRLVVFESQANGRYTPDQDGKFLAHRGSVDASQLQELGEKLEAHGWHQTQDLSGHSMPPPTPHGQWPK